MITNALKTNHDLRLMKLNTVLPLHPAKLPAWRGIEDALDVEPAYPQKY
jgi:hypothetical protein